MDWKELTIEVNKEAVEAVAALLQEKATQGVVLDENDTRTRITAYFHDDGSFERIYKEIKLRVEGFKDYGIQTGKILFSLQDTRDEDWATSWHRFFKPVEAGQNFVICPDWEECSSGNREVIYINPGRAFGIGGHETTRICITLLEKYITPKIVTMLDVGTGTGILAIIAARLGVERILAIDIDPAAVEAARENIQKNGVEKQVTVKPGDLANGVQDEYSIIVANLLPDLIINLMPALPGIMAEDTKLILSGIIKEKKNLIASHLHKLNLSIVEEMEIGEWIGLVVGKGV